MPRLQHLRTYYAYYKHFHPQEDRDSRILRGDTSRPRAAENQLTKPQEPCGTSILEKVGIPFGTVRLPPPMTRSRRVRQLNLLRTNGIPFGKVHVPPAKSKQATLRLIKQKIQQAILGPRQTKIKQKMQQARLRPR